MPGLLANQTNVDTAVLQAVDRATAELRRGGIVLVRGPGRSAALVQAAEGSRTGNLSAIRDLSRGVPLLLLTAQRAAVLGLAEPPSAPSPGGVVALDLTGIGAEAVAELADPTCRPSASLTVTPRPTASPSGLDAAAIDLAKLARLLPAAIFVPLGGWVDPKGWAAEQGLLSVSAAEIAEYRFSAARSLQPVAEATVPLAGAEATRIVAFRPVDGGFEHLAVIIGTPGPDQAVLTRVHSECFTGDLLGSLRCDCGEQLRGAISSIAESGAGVLLYLAQEGRGIGLVNKLRAYRLQDQGADTLEANQQLGFDADERIYLPAAEMLRQLGFRRVRLMTNNPEKVAALTRCGIAVEERVPLTFPSNGHNDFYLATKVRRLGHFT
jgi:GTP cyclohydrolase II